MKTQSASAHTGEQFGVNKICNVFEKSLFCSPRLHLFDPKYSKNNDIVKSLFYNVIYFWIVSSYYSSLQCLFVPSGY